MKRSLMFAAALAAIVAGVALVLTQPDAPPVAAPKPAAERPRLLLLTSLPLVFGERLELEEGGSAALATLDQHYRVEPIAATEASLLGSGAILLMAHPRAQPAEQLVELDAWVRGGGRMVLLADPALNWPSDKPLGDITRPPRAFADTGLLQHWGLRLDGPDPDGPARRSIDGNPVMTAAPGRLALLPGSACRLSDNEFVARCNLGKGRVTVIADADFLNVKGEHVPDDPIRSLDALAIALNRLATQ